MRLKLQEILLEYDVKGVTFDSRNIKAGDAFFAIKGEKFDGNDYIEAAFKQGAVVIFTDNPSKQCDKVIYVEDIRMSLALVAGMLYPHLPKNIIAITGTNGKSSVVSYVHQILVLLGKKSSGMGTLGLESTEKLPLGYANKSVALTTADPVTLRRNLQMLSEIGIENVAFEASSHGLVQRRLGDIKVSGAAFTSFSQDHLEYHQTMQSYLHAKLTLFTENLAAGAEVVINSDMMFFDFIKQFLIERGVTYSTVGLHGDLKIKKCIQSIIGQEVICELMQNKYHFNSDIIGSFQATNLLIAAKLVYNMGVDFDKIMDIMPKLQAVSGRLQRATDLHLEYQVFVDYAHTPDALEKSLTELKKIKEKAGKLYVVFGCGGDRDRKKRSIMGKIASEIADYVIITDDNPRTENAAQIRAEIADGAVQAEEIGDRKIAIIETMKRLQKGDILLIAGKGHEDYQIIGEEIIQFSDIELARSALS
ncbi:MAG: UDP-N-acetylmuramoyl-L-alanyl-D-glutamate--2,6-diaminopimelate ligase [Rickettsiaceae bacterium]|nr:UDP-N-acetylmuramoyl-L-alanyl-D-glutamate--2,6-diaminopimelate ligase [Rickettsiaceae bacterium]MDP4832872.1 UDP-N-acetylmuramoyl-L-alanyl-D-glutamate--2,6-diaminopimelate ligase [Rickettsiaceae bacterium]MDP5021072.1 UDP-N-acetylmuramoyl-L-alanyl-D-glutamate--2,6-diaminopimelate ligase [Rickettsiaceae bacterium]MDP5082800.1 UDP-N-acetylmuramoyl-L-alanyl-D-glutamate--2,6-diaminopimelate ligase [Rickettsiaceae bacterium]